MISVAAVLPSRFDHVGHKSFFVFAISWLMSLCRTVLPQLPTYPALSAHLV